MKVILIQIALFLSLTSKVLAQNSTEVLFGVGDQYEFRVPTPLIETKLEEAPCQHQLLQIHGEVRVSR